MGRVELGWMGVVVLLEMRLAGWEASGGASAFDGGKQAHSINEASGREMDS
jgi:hypothetical protein